MSQKVIKTGNSLAVTVPSEFVKLVGVRPGDSVKTQLNPDKGTVVYFFSGAKQLPLSDSFLKTKKR